VAVIDDDFAFLVATAERLIAQLGVDVDPDATYSKPGTALARHISETLGVIRDGIERERQRFKTVTSEVAKRTLSRQLRLYISMTWGIHDAMPWLERPHRQLDLGAVFFIDEAALAMVGPPVEVVPTESGYYMYWTLSWPFEELWEEQLHTAMPRGTRPIVIAYPPHEASSVLLHGAFAHELGHSAVDQHGLRDAVADPLLRSDAYLDGLRTLVKTTTDSAASATRVKIRELILGWIEELLCDQLALAYLGPSFVLCFTAMILPVTWNEPQSRHPNATMRVRLLLASLEALEWDDLIKMELPEIWSWLALAANTPLPVSDPLTSFVQHMSESVEVQVRDEAVKCLGAGLFDAGAYRSVAGKLGELLSNDILPAQLDPSTPADHRDIMLAA